MQAEPLAALGDLALSWLGDTATRDHPGAPRRTAPKLWTWLERAVCREQARRRGEDVGDPEPLIVTDLSEHEALAAAETATFALAAVRSLPTRIDLSEADEHAVAELAGLYEVTGETLRAGLALLEAPPVTH